MSDETIAKAEHAKRLMSDPLLVEVLDAIEERAINAWASTAIEDHEHREMAYYALKASRRVRDTLQGVIDNGLVAAARAVRPAGAG